MPDPVTRPDRRHNHKPNALKLALLLAFSIAREAVSSREYDGA
jgi:hypothetical protein